MHVSLPLKSFLPLLGLTVSAFVFNTSEFMPIALLTDISGSFGMQPEETGIMITVYAWMVALLSLPLMLLGSRMKAKPLLLTVITVFALGQAASGLASSFPLLMAGRIVVASAHAVFWSIAAPLATRLVDKEHSSMAISMIATGTSVAMIFGLPLGRVIGLALGWRMTFILIGVVSALAILYLAFVFPTLPKGGSFDTGKLPGLVRNPSIRCVFLVTLFFATGYYTFYSYIEPFLGEVAHFSAHGITAALVALGVSGLLGSALVSIVYARHPKGVLAVCGMGLVVPMLLFYLGPSLSAVEILGCVLLGILNTVYGVAMQAQIIRAADTASAPVAMSIYSGLFNVGIGGGTFIGGRITAWGDLSMVGLAGAVIALAGALYYFFAYRPVLDREGR